MSGIRRLKKQLAQLPIAMANTKITFNGCQVCLASPNPTAATKAAAEFARFLTHTLNRAKTPNMSDLYKAQLMVRDALGTDKLREIANIDN